MKVCTLSLFYLAIAFSYATPVLVNEPNSEPLGNKHDDGTATPQTTEQASQEQQPEPLVDSSYDYDQFQSKLMKVASTCQTYYSILSEDQIHRRTTPVDLTKDGLWDILKHDMPRLCSTIPDPHNAVIKLSQLDKLCGFIEEDLDEYENMKQKMDTQSMKQMIQVYKTKGVFL
ncbi:hypothetical protein BATDEDRAFT_27716 [Batrachochytrium dendrobatidis JAM81]|uniref:Secreted protein n=1 Tax=Batrachochytrium dendrobatidis (strain JAM81 / FGSC 10211) TaxID=684364 RepID=F4PBQ3_BATDJ|nr:uncharacterized protein BATDEDRAFT_27716 [Batrachochytrium dendrobatidis JAM81]EGF77366.1 hypothetical protein BATDEDRAFT_27716 [Batrachochytrium dendrobatidis JAM81]|eukprot:XP_006681945.1 hypothetical protein BATDEDRAFT_27716 [Batrachochytrium dendrobatidis JAM81]